MDNKAMITKTCYFLADIKKARIIEIDNSIENITGYPHKKFRKIDSRFIRKLLTSNDLRRFELARKLLFIYGKKQTDFVEDFNFVEEISLRHSSGSLKKLELKITILQYDKNGFPSYVLGELKKAGVEVPLQEQDYIGMFGHSDQDAIDIGPMGYRDPLISKKAV